jgi:xanthine dehydrogenase small subunit
MQQSVKFVLDNRIVEIDFSGGTGFKPTTTVLNYLRSLPGHKGVKEGCAEGDCGACTVVVGTPDAAGRMTYMTVDSCLVFLPMIHGKHLITIENLAEVTPTGKKLHPVQQEMVDQNGSQCGYCTPGIVMSLFGLYKNHTQPSDVIIRDALVGNLCRCTGYQPILEAARKACEPQGLDHFSRNEETVLNLLNEIAADSTGLVLTGCGQTYYRPFTLGDALKIRKKNPEAIIINGSTDVALRQTKKHEFFPVILDLSGIDAIKNFREEAEDYVFGAGMPMEQVKAISNGKLPALNEILSVFGSLQIRNLATLGGNVCSASPIGDTLPLLLVYQARLKLVSEKSERFINFDTFITGYRKTALKKNELLAEIWIPKVPEQTTISTYKISRRRDLDISTVSASVRLKTNHGTVAQFMMAFGGMAEMTKRAVKTEAFLQGKPWSKESVVQAMEILADEFSPISDARSEADYRKKVAQNLLLKFFLETKNGTK